MVERARTRLAGHRRFRFAVIDGEHPRELAHGPPFDLICSSFAAQWFGDLPGALQRLFEHVRPGGHLVVATLAAGTLSEWRAAHIELGLEPGAPSYPTLESLRAIHLDRVAGQVEVDVIVEHHRDGMAFARALKAIGAETTAAGRAPLGPARMRAVLRRFEARGATASYHVATCHFVKPA